MPVISACPKCQKPVTVPGGVEWATLVRCPHCEVEYPLREALPPVLIPVAAPADAAGMAESAWAAEIVVESPAAGEDHAETSASKDVSENEAVAAGRVMTAGFAMRRPRKSALRTLIEVLAGGLMGILVAYYGLAFWLGPQFKALDFPNLPLTGWVTTLRGVEDAAGKQPAAKNHGAAKSANGKMSQKESSEAGK